MKTKQGFGKAKEYFINVVLSYDGDECLLWPFYRGANGYAYLTIKKRPYGVSRLVCIEAYGPPPSPDHQAAHSCGKGNLGCVAKKHLRWATPSENQREREVHGTSNHGERNGVSKLTADKAREIRDLKGKESQTAIALRYGINQTTVSRIHLGRYWPSI